MKQVAFDVDTDFVGIDCLALPEKFSGAAYYIYYLTKNLLEAPRNYPLSIFCKPQHQRIFRDLLGTRDKIFPVPLKNRADQLHLYEFRLKRILLKENVKIFYATHYICPPPDERYHLISTFHDMGFLLYPRYYPLIKRLYFGRRMKTFLERSDHVVAVSQSTADSLAKLFPQYSPRIKVICPGADHLPLERTYSLLKPAVASPFILAVNTFELRKNIPFIIRVFNSLKTRANFPHKLLLIGHPANGYSKIMAEVNRSPFRKEIILLNSLSSTELTYYYKSCDLFINASEYEGFGFTPFEALNQNCPVFLYKNNTVAEFLGDHPYIFNHLDADVWADFIWNELMNSFKLKMDREAIRHLSWSNTAKETFKLLDTLVSTKDVSLAS